MIHPGKVAEVAVPVGAVNFLFRELDQAVEVPRVAFPQQRVEQHRAERGGKRERQPRLEPVAPPALKGLEQRQVGFGDGLEQPALLQKFFMFRMPHEWQVRMEDDGKVALHREKLFVELVRNPLRHGL